MMGISLLSKGSLRQPASVVIWIGSEGNEITGAYGALKSVNILTNREGAATGTLAFETGRDEAGGVDLVDDDQFTPCTKIFVLADFVDHQEEIFRGYIKATSPNFPLNPGEASFNVEIQDDSLILQRQHARELFGFEGEQSDKQILEILAGQGGL